MNWDLIVLLAGLSFGALLIWVLINYLFIEVKWGDKVTMILVITVLLANITYLSWELILDGYWIVVPGVFITGFMLIAQVWLLKPTTKAE